jgi:hypothetical protein
MTHILISVKMKTVLDKITLSSSVMRNVSKEQKKSI